MRRAASSDVAYWGSLVSSGVWAKGPASDAELIVAGMWLVAAIVFGVAGVVSRLRSLP
jgi:hypothetical protein